MQCNNNCNVAFCASAAFGEKVQLMELRSGQFIAGKWRKGLGADAISPVDPATEETLNQFPAASVEDTEEAITSAHSAQGASVTYSVQPVRR